MSHSPNEQNVVKVRRQNRKQRDFIQIPLDSSFPFSLSRLPKDEKRGFWAWEFKMHYWPELKKNSEKIAI